MTSDQQAYFDEVFEFVGHERDDVRKMALQGLAQHSRDNAALNMYLRSHENAVQALMNRYTAQNFSVLGDILTVLANTGADTMVAEAFVSKGKIVTRTMRLLDGLAASEEAAALPLTELALILLNNLTATHVSAVDELLQLQDEDLKGFYLGKLCTLFDRQPDDAPRDLKKWILQTILNISRLPEAQVALLQDDEWVLNLNNLVESTNETHRLLAVQVYTNCASTKSTHEAFLKTKVVPLVVSRLQRGEEKVMAIQMLQLEILAGAMQTAEGINALEEINAKKHLQEGLQSKTIHGEAATFALEHVLPFLDDITDAYVMDDDKE